MAEYFTRDIRGWCVRAQINTRITNLIFSADIPALYKTFVQYNLPIFISTILGCKTKSYVVFHILIVLTYVFPLSLLLCRYCSQFHVLIVIYYYINLFTVLMFYLIFLLSLSNCLTFIFILSYFHFHIVLILLSYCLTFTFTLSYFHFHIVVLSL